MSTGNLYKKNRTKHSRINRIQCFLRSNAGFKIGIIIITFVVIALIEFGLVLVLFLGEFLGNDFLMSYAKQRIIYLNISEVSILFRVGFLSMVFGIIIGIFSIEISTISSHQSKKWFQKYLSLILIVLGILFLIFPF